jgi:G3E family GTPase
MVTVVDAVHFFDYVDSEKSVQDTGEAVGPDDVRVLSQLLIDQVEFADVILINKCDLATPAHLDRVEHVIRSLNSYAEIVRTTWSVVPLAQVLNTGKFDFERAALNPGWLKVMRGAEMVPETEEYGITSFLYEATRPFHPQRLYTLTGQATPLPNVIRSKGFVWLANHQRQGIWASAGRMYSVEPDPSSEDADGDCHQQIVLIGLNLDRQLITTLLNICLATEEEMAAEDWGEDDPYEDFSMDEGELSVSLPLLVKSLQNWVW